MENTTYEAVVHDKKFLYLNDTNFVPFFKRNLSGDRARGYRGSNARTAAIMIPDADIAERLKAEGYNVRKTEPQPGKEDEYVPIYYFNFSVKYDLNYPPKVYQVTDKETILLGPDTIGRLDDIRIGRIKAVFAESEKIPEGSDYKQLYLRVLYAEQDLSPDAYDPYAAAYQKQFSNGSTEDEALPWEN